MATETILSPGVLLQEVDKSFVSPGTDPSGMAIIGPTARGPIEIPTQIKNYNEFKEVFGTTIKSGSGAYEYFTNLAVKNYFENGGASALVVRVVSASGTWGSAANTHLSASAKNSTQPFTLTTLGKGADLNNTGDDLEYTGGALKTGSKDNFRWEVSNVNTKSGTFTVSIRRGDDTTNAPIVLEQFTNCSLDPLSPNYISRKIGDQSYTVAADGDDYVVNVSGEFENKSNLVRVSAVNLPTYQYLAPNGSVALDSTGTSYSASLPIAERGSFQNATGNNIATGVVSLYGSQSAQSDAHGAIQRLQSADYTNAISILKNKDEVKFKTNP